MFSAIRPRTRLAGSAALLLGLATATMTARSLRVEPIELDYYRQLAAKMSYRGLDMGDPLTDQQVDDVMKLPESPWRPVTSSCKRVSPFVVASRTVHTQHPDVPYVEGPNLPKSLPRESLKPARALERFVALEVGRDTPAFTGQRPFEPIGDEPRAGLSVRVINRSNEPLAFYAEKSTITVVQQALDRDGYWRDIEDRMPVTICVYGGHIERHELILEPGEYWTVVAPRYGGTFQTLLRFKLESRQVYLWKGPLRQRVAGFVPADYQTNTYLEDEVYSAPFHGSIHPDQFHKRDGCDNYWRHAGP